MWDPQFDWYVDILQDYLIWASILLHCCFWWTHARIDKAANICGFFRRHKSRKDSLRFAGYRTDGTLLVRAGTAGHVASGLQKERLFWTSNQGWYERSLDGVQNQKTWDNQKKGNIEEWKRCPASICDWPRKILGKKTTQNSTWAIQE